MPFTPSHVECVTPEGKYVGQRIDGGMQAREPGYDSDGLAHEIFIELPVSDEQSDAFYTYVNSKIGQPYDWKAIVDYAMPVNMHDYDHAICSAMMSLALRACDYFRWPLACPAHLISPRDLFLMLSGMLEIPHQ